MIKKEMRAEVETLIKFVAMLADRLQVLRHELHNRPPQTRGRKTSKPVDAPYIRELHVANPTLPQHKIAVLADTNQGRVSETLAGKRT